MRFPSPLITRSDATPEQDRSNSIKLAAWVMLGVTVATFIIRQTMKAIIFRKIGLDDMFISLSTVLFVGLSVALYILATEGLGVFGFLTPERATTLMKGYYATELLYTATICFSKMSIVFVFYAVVAGRRRQRQLVLAFEAFILAWSVSSLIVIAFQCQMPRPWEMMTLRCFNTRVFWIVYCIIDMTTEMAIIMLSINLVVYLRMRTSRKLAVVACFAPRSLVLAASLVRLVWLYPITPHSDPKYRLWLPAIFTQAHASISICTACIPYMVPFLKTLGGDFRKRWSSKEVEFRMKSQTTEMSSLWFRRHAKAKIFDSRDSTAAASFQYERVPETSPCIPTLRALSPLTPPLYISRPSTACSRSPGTRGLCISIPDSSHPIRQRADTISPRTESSFALSPLCTAPSAPLQSASYKPVLTAPTPPHRTHSPQSSVSSSNYSTDQPSPMSPTRPARFSLFPQQYTSGSRYSPEPRHSGFTPVSIAPIRALRPQVQTDISRHPTVLGLSVSAHNQQRKRSVSAANPPKFSTAPHPTSPPSTTTSPDTGRKHASAQELTSPMGTAIDLYFESASPEYVPPAPTPAAAPLSPHRRRNQQVLSPSNTLRTYGASQKTPPSSPLPPLPSHDPGAVTRTLRAQTLPSLKDARSSPRIVVREPS